MKTRIAILLILLIGFCFTLANAEPKQILDNPPQIDINTFDPTISKSNNIKDYSYKAYQAYDKKDYETAAKYLLVYLKSNPESANNWYTLACCYGLLDKPMLASKYLKLAYKAGFSDVGHIEKDIDFDKVKTNETFLATVDSIKTWSKRKAYLTGKKAYFPAKNLMTYWIHIPKNFDAKKSYTLLIGLHGQGGKADEFSKMWEHIDSENIIYVVPEAPYPPFDGEYFGFSWMPLPPYDNEAPVKALDMLSETLTDLVKDMKSTYNVKQTWLFGFVQGACYAYLLAIENPKDFNGVIASNGVLWSQFIDEKDYEPANKVKILISHSKQDPNVPVTYAENAYKTLKSKGFDVTMETFEGGSVVDPNVFKTFEKMIK